MNKALSITLLILLLGVPSLFANISSSADQKSSALAQDSVTLTMTIVGQGRLGEEGTFKVAQGEELSIGAYPIAGHVVDSWDVTEGDPTFLLKISRGIHFICEENTAITVTFIRTTIAFDGIQDDFHYSDDALDSNYSKKVWFEYTAAQPGTYALTIDDPHSQISKDFTFFGGDSLYPEMGGDSVVSSRGEIFFNFTTTEVDEVVYFNVATDNYRYKRLTFSLGIDYLANPVALSVTQASGGEILIMGNPLIESGDSIKVYYEKNPGYQFEEWVVTSHGEVHETLHSNTAFVVLTGDVTLTAKYRRFQPHTLLMTEQQFNYTTSAEGQQYQKRVWFSFLAEDVDDYVFEVVDGVEGNYPIVNYFGTDTSYTNVLRAPRVLPEGKRAFHFSNTQKDTRHFFSVVVHSTAAASHNFTALVKKSFALTYTETAGNRRQDQVFMASPGEKVLFTTGVVSGYEFNEWRLVQDSDKSILTEGLNQTAVVEMNSDVTLNIDVTRIPRHSIGATETVLNYTTSAHLNNPRKGIWVEYESPAPGKYVLEIADDGRRVWYKRVSGFGSDTTYSDNDYLNVDTGTVYFPFESTVTDEKLVFALFTARDLDYEENIAVVVKPLAHLTIQSNEFGNTNITQKNVGIGSTVLIEAWAKNGYAFVKWEHSTGLAVIDDVTNNRTTVALSEDTEITAVFAKAPVKEVTKDAQTFTFGKDVAKGFRSTTIWFKYTTDKVGMYTLEINEEAVKPNIKHIDHYGLDSTFTTVDSSTRCKKEKGAFNFMSESIGAVHYFGVRTNSYAVLTDFTIKAIAFQESAALTTTVQGRGYSVFETNPIVESGEKVMVRAGSLEGSFFKEWKLMSGDALFDDPHSAETGITVNSNAEVQAVFEPYTAYVITEDYKKFNHNTEAQDTSGYTMIFMAYTVKDVGEHIFQVDSITSFGSLDYYGTDATYENNSKGTWGGTTYKFIDFTVTKPNTTYYFSVGDYKVSGLGTFTARVRNKTTMVNITVEASKGGRASASKTVVDNSPATVTLLAKPEDGYALDYWETVSGTGTVHDETSAETKVTVETDIVLKAYFKPIERYVLVPGIHVLNIAEDAEQVNPRALWFEVEAPQSGTYTIAIDTVGNRMKRALYSYKQDSTYNELDAIEYKTGRIFYNVPHSTTPKKYFFQIRCERECTTNRDFIVSMRNIEDHVGLILSNEMGYVEFLDNTIALPGDTLGIDITHWKEGYTFSHWSVTEGEAVILDSLSPRSAVVMTTDAVVTAHFSPKVIRIPEDTLLVEIPEPKDRPLLDTLALDTLSLDTIETEEIIDAIELDSIIPEKPIDLDDEEMIDEEVYDGFDDDEVDEFDELNDSEESDDTPDTDFIASLRFREEHISGMGLLKAGETEVLVPSGVQTMVIYSITGQKLFSAHGSDFVDGAVAIFPSDSWGAVSVVIFYR
ncbi:MAG: hypothetical protein OCD01_04475 [Fibrobacterales bacterium]